MWKEKVSKKLWVEMNISKGYVKEIKKLNIEI